MKDFILEIYSEEIPPLLQNKAAQDLATLADDILTEDGIEFDEDKLQTFISPKRLTLFIGNLKIYQIRVEEKKIGPKVGANQKAIDGFLKSNGLSDVNELVKVTNKGKKYYAYNIPEKKIKTSEILQSSLDKILDKIPNIWPRLMRWDVANQDVQPQWIRPVRNILCLFGSEVLDIKFAGLKSNNLTYYGLVDSKLSIEDAADYKKALRDKDIIFDHKQRKKEILSQLQTFLDSSALELFNKEGDKIFDEVTGLTESPTVLIAAISQHFMTLPDEILTLTLKSNQKYLCLRDGDGNLSPKFAFVAQCSDEKSKKRIIADNEKVVTARLSDAKFFIEEDLKLSLEQRSQDLHNVVFHRKLGSMYDKSQRLAGLTKFLAIFVPHCDLSLVDRLSLLCKADLATKAVAEFSDLQGKIGSFYAHKSGEDDKIIAAIYEHYMPVAAESQLPKTSLGVVLSIADKIDTIVGLFLAGDRPTSSRDPYALRRAVIGIIRIGFYHNIAFPIRILVEKSLKAYPAKLITKQIIQNEDSSYNRKNDLVEDVVRFFVERLKIYLKENDNLNPEVVNVVIDHYLSNISSHKYCDILYLAKKIKFVDKIIFGDDRPKIIPLYKRVARILRIEEKKEEAIYFGKPSKITFKTKYEITLYKRVRQISNKFSKLIHKGEFDEAFVMLKILEEPLAEFFDNVVVNDEDPRVRENRLVLLSTVRSLFEKIYGISQIEIP